MTRIETGQGHIARGARLAAAWKGVARRSGRVLALFLPRSVTGRIAAFNVMALAVFVIGVWVTNVGHTPLIEERGGALGTQARIIANALGEGATVEPQGIGASAELPRFDLDDAAEILRRFALPAGYRARLYDRQGALILDTAWLHADVIMRPLTRPSEVDAVREALRDVGRRIEAALNPRPIAPYREGPDITYEEVRAALAGIDDPEAVRRLRRTSDGRLILTAAETVQRYRAYVGALFLTAEGEDIDALIWAEREALLGIFLVALIANVLIALFINWTVARPLRSLAGAADRLKTGRAGSSGDRDLVPDLSGHAAEISALSTSMREMTQALFNRLESIEAFAADVAHEVKNPLTSIRSAVETMEYARDEASRARLMAVVQDDLRRLDRLITDISDASRVDAELARENTETVDMARLLRSLADIWRDTRREGQAEVQLRIDTGARADAALPVSGIESRLAQVMRNLVANALSFSPPDGSVRVTARLVSAGREHGEVVITVEDDGPGIPEENLETIFRRFYTQRPEAEGFGKHSGLGLSISRQIVVAHRGRIWAENKHDATGRVTGARFVVALPATRRGEAA